MSKTGAIQEKGKEGRKQKKLKSNVISEMKKALLILALVGLASGLIGNGNFTILSDTETSSGTFCSTTWDVYSVRDPETLPYPSSSINEDWMASAIFSSSQFDAAGIDDDALEAGDIGVFPDTGLANDLNDDDYADDVFGLEDGPSFGDEDDERVLMRGAQTN